MRSGVYEGFLIGLEKAAEKRSRFAPLLSAVGGTALGAGTAVTMMRLLQEKMPDKKIPLPVQYLGPASAVVGGALLLASAMQDRAEREAYRAIDDQERSNGSGGQSRK